MMRTVDVLYSVPFVPFVIVLTMLFGRQLWLMFVAIGAVSWLDIARIVRGQTLSLKRREFIEAARVAGAHGAAMIGRHIVPNLIGIVIDLRDADHSHRHPVRGLAELPRPGRARAAGLARLAGRRWRLRDAGTSASADGAGAVLATIIYCFNFLGDGLRDLLDPRA